MLCKLIWKLKIISATSGGERDDVRMFDQWELLLGVYCTFSDENICQAWDTGNTWQSINVKTPDPEKKFCSKCPKKHFVLFSVVKKIFCLINWSNQINQQIIIKCRF